MYVIYSTVRYTSGPASTTTCRCIMYVGLVHRSRIGLSKYKFQQYSLDTLTVETDMMFLSTHLVRLIFPVSSVRAGVRACHARKTRHSKWREVVSRLSTSTDGTPSRDRKLAHRIMQKVKGFFLNDCANRIFLRNHSRNHS
jgi:hypothetical protein